MTGGIKGLDSLMKKYNSMTGSITGQGLEKAVGASIKMVQGEAKLLCPVNDGELRQSIKTSVYSQDEKVIGVAYTNKKHGPYVELGTGPKGEADHAGISPEVSPSYTQSPWWIHESQIDAATAEKYHMFHIDTPEGRFYQSSGQAAQPFMYPALKNNEERATRNIKNYLAREIRKAVQD
ncbi:HK97-gp10 family putative phage morphogenesis protein [Lacrimispora xylanisolvens]|uniref:HK97-gp10 family putative phage morphogenesis protein n=1 Tax=Lacrimispora xylanisolvens TaxID=384636 RepID=UPI00240290D2